MQKRILVVDDSASIRQLLSFILEKAGFGVEVAIDGHDALKFLDGRTFDLVLTDLNMPHADGISLIRQVRSNDDYKRVPIVVLTTESHVSFKNEAKEAGATGWVVKPFVADKLLSVISKVVR
jgi:two-component system, chemotaxis family, chemotaxis protein CheY